jgi:hypothetical protein
MNSIDTNESGRNKIIGLNSVIKNEWAISLRNYSLAFCMAFMSINSSAQTLDECKATSQIVNKSLPIKKDNLTILRETACITGMKKQKFIYIMEVSLSKEDANNIDFKYTLKPRVLNTFCSDPQVRVILNAFDVDHHYYTKNGEFMGSFLMSSIECK